MLNGWFDVPPEAIAQYQIAAKKKRGICCQELHGRFALSEGGTIFFETLVCKGLNGQNTGTSAPYCKNCVLEGRPAL